MKKSKLTEKNFEVEYVVKTLVEKNGYIERDCKKHYNPRLFLDSEILLKFIKSSQRKEWNKLKEHYGDEVEEKFLKRVSNEIDKRGTLDVLRNGVQDRGARFELAFFKPVSGLNPEHKALYEKNKFSVIHQLIFSDKYGKSLDISLFLNGIPIITAELKNHFTGQDYTHAINQYRFDRDPKESLLKRCLAHFAVDNDKVYFTTKLIGPTTRFLPFNRSIENPDDSRGFKVSYLYYDIWHPDGLLEIIAHFLQEKDNLVIFPRFHQLMAIKRLVKSVKEIGHGKNYLVQHSAGSGKTYTISWLAHHLSQIHNQNNERIFDTVVVVSDRKVIDKQLRDAIFQFEKVSGVVIAAKRARDLKEGLETGKNIIVTTVQKFPFVVDEISKLAGKTFAVIIDEAHSSQGGMTSRAINRTLSYSSLEKAEEEDIKDVSIEDKIIQDIRAKGKLENVGFFAFTSTPKKETLELFGEKKSDGSFKPFSLYSMKQAIQEGFILDVLENYINYKTYFKLVKKIEEDPEYEKRKVTALLCRYVNLHKHAIKEKTEIMLDHFDSGVKNKLQKKAKVMVVTKSRLHAVRYKLEFDKQLAESGSNIKILVAFTGVVKDRGGEFSESSMNGFPESQTRDKFDSAEYRVLIVASKYQTGFDQPLLQTMYVDKKLFGVNAVQALSRLNREYPGKDGVIVLDFVNEPEDIQESFQPYYETIILSEGTDPNRIYDFERKISGFNIVDINNVNEFVYTWYQSDNQSKLHKALAPTVERYKELSKEDRKDFRDAIRKYVKMYSFISQLVRFEDVDLEKLYLYYRLLLKKIPIDKDSLPKEVLESVDMSKYRNQKIYEGRLILKGEDTEVSYGDEEGAKQKEEKDRLSAIINNINEAHNAHFTDDDKVKIKQIGNSIKNDQNFKASKETNSKSNLKLLFETLFDQKFGDMYEDDFKFYEKIGKSPNVKKSLKEMLFEAVFSDEI